MQPTTTFLGKAGKACLILAVVREEGKTKKTADFEVELNFWKYLVSTSQKETGQGPQATHTVQVNNAWQPGLEHMKGNISPIKHEKTSKETQQALHEWRGSCLRPVESQVRVGARKDRATPHLRTICAESQHSSGSLLCFLIPPFSPVKESCYFWITDFAATF